jgi:hypothetical protein
VRLWSSGSVEPGKTLSEYVDLASIFALVQPLGM